MRRGRGKGRKFSAVISHEDAGSGGEECLSSYKRRGRTQKPLKEEPDEEEVEKIEEADDEGVKDNNFIKEMNDSSIVEENGKKRKRNPMLKQQNVSTKEENSTGARSSTEGSTKANGFRQNGSRRKSKPRRAAEFVNLSVKAGQVQINASGRMVMGKDQPAEIDTGKIKY